MKVNKFLMVCVLLAIMTIGSVSASDNITQEDAVTAVADDVSLNTSSSDDFTGESFYDGDFYITVEENYTQDFNNWNSSGLIYISSYCQNNGTFSILVDDVERQFLNLTDGYFSIEDNGYGGTYEKYFMQVFPNELGLGLGTYNVKVKFNGNTLTDCLVTLKQKDDFDIYMSNPYYVEEDYWASPSFIVIDSNHQNTGTLEILVNGNAKVSYAVVNGSFDEIEDCSNKSRYLAASDLLDGYGTYDIKIVLRENGINKTLKEDNVTVAEFEPTTNPKLELYLDLYTVNLPADDAAHIYLPREATGTLTISYNDVKNRTVTYSKGMATHYINAWELNHLGENTITVTYTGDDFGTLTATQTVIVVPGITAPFYASTGEKFKITMCTHEWVSGNFNVYDYNGGKKGKLLASSNIANRFSTVELSSTTVGLNRFYLEFAYPGGYYPVIQEVYVVKNSDNISVSVPDNVELGSDVTVNISAPATPFNFAYVSIDGGENEFYSMQEGKVVRVISGLPAGYHTISVQYNDGYYEDGKLLGDVYSKTFNVKVGIKTKISAPKVSTTYNVAKDLVITLKDANGKALSKKKISIKLNGKTYSRTSDSKGQVKLSVSLPAKTYTATFSFDGDSTYFKSSGSAKIVVSKATPKLIASSKSFKAKAKTKKVTVTLKNNKNGIMKNTRISLNVNKKTYYAKTNSKGIATFYVKLTKKGNYNAVYKYAASSNYHAASKSVKIYIR